jgi:hypothetical protein
MALRRFTRHRTPPASPHQDLADTGPKDQELEERRLATAIVAGEVPPIWYRQRMAALAAGRDVADPVEGQPPA